MTVRLLLLGLTAFMCCAPSVCEKRPVAEFIGKLSVHGIAAEDSNSAVSAPSIENGAPLAHNWTASMPAPGAPPHSLSKRAGEPSARRYGPLWPQGKNCVFCPEQQVLEEDAMTTIRKLTPQKMKTYMRGTASDLNNRCVFYTRAEDRTAALSGPATEWACLYNKYSIWHLWPNQRMAQQNKNVKDFYGIYEPGNWLYKVVELQRSNPPRVGAPYPTRYFQAMSQAMAESCSGEVVILSERPDKLHERYSTLAPGNTEFMNIWGDRERPALMSLKRRGIVTKLYVVDARGYFGAHSDYPTVYDYDIINDRITGESDKVFVPGMRRVMPRELLGNDTVRAEWGELHRLQKRACDKDNAVGSEMSGYDYFAGFYDKDYPA